jgi:hypothetical protein
VIGAMLSEPWWLIAWLCWLGAVNLASLFFLRESEARWVLAAFLSSFVLMNVLYYNNGYNRFLGFAHIVFWTPLLLFLYSRLSRILGPRLYENWIRILLATNGVSLVIDYVDVLRYLLGDRT